MRLALEPTEDILAGVAADRRADQTLVGFAAETGGSLERARSKLERKAVDAIVFNDVSRPDIGFDSTSNEVTILERSGEHQVARASKEDVAEAILDRIEALRAKLTKQT
jgi:phosphopantothenoylcysteine decarboxylase/phosphopantothenate--cysteine ligase